MSWGDPAYLKEGEDSGRGSPKNQLNRSDVFGFVPPTLAVRIDFDLTDLPHGRALRLSSEAKTM